MIDSSGRYPSFLSSNLNAIQGSHSRQSFKAVIQSPQFAKIVWEARTLKIPKFKTPFKFSGKYSGELVKVNSVTISKNASGKYFASIQGVFEIPEKESTGEIIGVDLGIKTLLVDSNDSNDSNGTEIKNERFLKKHLKKLKYLQRQHSKKKKGSNSREKSRIKLAREYQKVTDQRNNYLHQVSTNLPN